MRLKRLLYTAFFALIMISCGKDDTPKPPEETNNAPSIEARTFSVNEDITDTHVIGIMEASDDENDVLIFEITQNDNAMFEIDSGTGSLSLADGMTLDFESSEAHMITVGVNDGVNATVEVQIKITVINVIETLQEDPESFITKWKTETPNQNIVFHLHPPSTYDFTIDWGDGFIEQVNTSEDLEHTYEVPGTYKVAINGIFPRGGSDLDTSVNSLVGIEQWGGQEWTSLFAMFQSCENLEYNAIDNPNLSMAIATTASFYGASSFNGNINNWNVSTILSTASMFHNATSFNQDLNNWTMDNVEDMTNMFFGAASFNGNISNWNVESVNLMGGMFKDATSFSQSLANWKIGNVENMENMFDNSGMSPTDYGNTLIGWSQLANIPPDITLGALNVEYCDTPEVQEARTILEAAGWTFVGDAPVNCN